MSPQIFPSTSMTVMVVLWPKMKAPQTSVKAPQRVRVTLRTQSASSVTLRTQEARRHGDRSPRRPVDPPGAGQVRSSKPEPLTAPSDRRETPRQGPEQDPR